MSTTAPTLKPRIKHFRVKAHIYTSLSQTKVSGLQEDPTLPELSRHMESCRLQQLVVMKKSKGLALLQREPILPLLHAESARLPVLLSETVAVGQGRVLTLAAMPCLRAEMLNILPILQLKRAQHVVRELFIPTQCAIVHHLSTPVRQHPAMSPAHNRHTTLIDTCGQSETTNDKYRRLSRRDRPKMRVAIKSQIVRPRRTQSPREQDDPNIPEEPDPHDYL
jgi:hypothetical protein